jgi:hypothetical protein
MNPYKEVQSQNDFWQDVQTLKLKLEQSFEKQIPAKSMT